MTPTVDDTASLPDESWWVWADMTLAPVVAGLVLLGLLGFACAGWWIAHRRAEHYRIEVLRLGRAASEVSRRCACGRYPMASLQLTDTWGSHEVVGCEERASR